VYFLVGVVFGRCGCQYPVPYAVRGAEPSHVIGGQMLFCADVDASVTLASLDGVVRTVTALCNWLSPLYITLRLQVDVP
jgi:hypothetical protein